MSDQENLIATTNSDGNNNNNIYFPHQPTVGHQYAQVDYPSYMGPDFQHSFFPNQFSQTHHAHAAAVSLYQHQRAAAYEGWQLNNYGPYGQLVPGSLPSNAAPSAPYLNGQPSYAASTAPPFVSQPSPSPSPKLGNVSHDSAHDPTSNSFYTSFGTRTQSEYSDIENSHNHSSPDTGDLSALGAAALPVERSMRPQQERAVDDWMRRTYISPPLETSAEDESTFINIQNMTLKSDPYEEEEAEQKKEEAWSTDQQVDDSERRENSWKTDAEETHECKVEEIVQRMKKLGKTRTKDKYRVVYTDFQRHSLENEFHLNRYINSLSKAKLASDLTLSERQVKIWFQNRRAKERKLMKKESGRVDNPYVQIQYASPHHQQMPPHHSPPLAPPHHSPHQAAPPLPPHHQPHHQPHHPPIHRPHHTPIHLPQPIHNTSHYLAARQPRSS